MLLNQLLPDIEVSHLVGPAPAGLEISGLAYDSRRVKPGWLFAALPGAAADGHDYLAAAVKAGAAAALVERPIEGLAGLCQVVVPCSRLALARAAEKFYGEPSRSMILVGITGTNGKTTVCHMVEAILAAAGHRVGILGTVEIRYGQVRIPAAMTTPESVELSATLADMAAGGVTACVMEVSSHALSQHRVDGVLFDVGVFTNLTRDHLDYHGTSEAYYNAKKRLFGELLPRAQKAGKPAGAIVCMDGAYGARLARELDGGALPVITYGLTRQADVHLAGGSSTLNGGACRIEAPQGGLDLELALTGRYNQQNLLAATAACLTLGIAPNDIRAGFKALAGVPGRLERVGRAGQWPAVFVDYAHTPDALANVLAALTPLTPGRLFCVFGAGGNRDNGKRPLMGEAVAKGCSLAVLTSDNPRNEDPQAIMSMVEEGLIRAGCRPVASLDGAKTGSYIKEEDRARAIAAAINAAGQGDVVLIAGKGHEDYQDVAGRKHHFDDREQAAAVLAAPEKEAAHA